ncbi:MAG: ribosome-associated translation inhibitor RaiA [Actinomycetota bacterium]
MDIIFKGRHTEVLERFRRHASAKLTKIVRLDSKAVRIDVEVSTERNPRQAGRRERVELTISSRGPTIRAEAAAEDRFTALDMALAKLESRLRRSGDRRKCRHATPPAARSGVGAPAGLGAPELAGFRPAEPAAGDLTDGGPAYEPEDDVIAIPMEGEGPLVVREKSHGAEPMSIDQALFEMELVGHDFFLFRDTGSGQPSVVYRRRGYQYGLLRLVEDSPVTQNAAAQNAAANGMAQLVYPPNGNGHVPSRAGRPAAGRGMAAEANRAAG